MIGTRKKANLGVRLDPHDHRFQELRIGDSPPVRLSLHQVREMVAIMTRLLPEQQRHVDGAKIVLPTKVERLA